VDAVVDQGAERCCTAARAARSSQRGDLRDPAGHLLKFIQGVIPKTEQGSQPPGGEDAQMADMAFFFG
jgi:hypothetical protein